MTETNVTRVAVTKRSTSSIAWWAWFLAAAAFVFFLVFFNSYVPRQPNPPSRPVTAILGEADLALEPGRGLCAHRSVLLSLSAACAHRWGSMRDW